MSMPAPQIPSSMTLRDLLGGIADAPDIAIHGIANDTRELGKGFAFFACSGEQSHGLDYAQQAVDAGAAAIVYDSAGATATPQVEIPLVRVADLRRHLGEIANRYYDHPSRAVSVIGITGTNGKTTVAWLLSQALQLLDKPCAYAGTLGYGISEVDAREGLTTPDVVEMHRRLASFRDGGATCAAIEVSSHALAQHRIDGVAVDTAMFTNLSRDHLDYHGDMRAYAEAKAALFTVHKPRRRIVNRDSRFGAELAARIGSGAIVVSADPDWAPGEQSYVCLRSASAVAGGSRIVVDSSWGEAKVSLPLPGHFNIENALLVLAFLLSDGVPLESACGALENVSAPPGRLELVDSSTGPAVYVDYAHTPHALDVVLQALRPHCAGALSCVFGCGGDRDQGKRPLMATVAEQHADRIVVTTDNPRSEDPAVIIEGIVAGFSDRADVTVIEDRATAIAWAIEQAQDDDTILIAGKGHENYQLIGNERHDFSDRSAASANLERRAERGEGDK
jgi:UDP-N-acetylmuramoyl-L-alanyl-D-glutamate--2,6-diaminopimelate ligase